MDPELDAVAEHYENERKFVSILPELSMQADKVLDAYLSFTAFDNLDDEVNTDEAKERNALGKDLEGN